MRQRAKRATAAAPRRQRLAADDDAVPIVRCAARRTAVVPLLELDERRWRLRRLERLLLERCKEAAGPEDAPAPRRRLAAERGPQT
jgi:hypothetical protein